MTSRPEYFADAQVPDMERRTAEMVSIGTVIEQDYSNPKAPRVRVETGAQQTGWIAFSSGSAGGNSDWEPLDVGEQVVMVAPSGDLSQAIIVGTVHQDSQEAPDKDPDVSARRWKDGSQQSFNRKESAWTLKLVEAGNFTVEIGSTKFKLDSSGATLDANRVTVNAGGGMQFNTPTLNVSGDVVAGGVSLINHLHTGVMVGAMLSGPPLGGAGGGGGSGGGGGGDGMGSVASDEPGTPGNPENGTFDNGVPKDATGLFLAAPVVTRREYGVPFDFGSDIAREYYGLSVWQGRYPTIPFDAAAITESTYYDRVRLALIQYAGDQSHGLFLQLVSNYDAATDTWSDDLIERRPWETQTDPIHGYYNAPIDVTGVYDPALSYGFAYRKLSAPYTVYKSRGGNLYAMVMDGINQSGVLYWKISDAEFAANGVPA